MKTKTNHNQNKSILETPNEKQNYSDKTKTIQIDNETMYKGTKVKQYLNFQRQKDVKEFIEEMKELKCNLCKCNYRFGVCDNCEIIGVSINKYEQEKN